MIANSVQEVENDRARFSTLGFRISKAGDFWTRHHQPGLVCSERVVNRYISQKIASMTSYASIIRHSTENQGLCACARKRLRMLVVV